LKKPSRKLLVSLVIACVIAGIVGGCLYEGWYMMKYGPFSGLDSDKEAVPVWVINEKLQWWTGAILPKSARDIRVVFSGGPDPFMMLRFRAEPEEAGAFAQCVRDHSRLEDAPMSEAQRKSMNETIRITGGDKDWWHIPPGAHEWFRSGYMFLALDETTGTVYFSCELDG